MNTTDKIKETNKKIEEMELEYRKNLERHISTLQTRLDEYKELKERKDKNGDDASGIEFLISLYESKIIEFKNLLK